MRYIKPINDFLFEVLNSEQDLEYKGYAEERDSTTLSDLQIWFTRYATKNNYSTQTVEDGEIDRIYIPVDYSKVMPTKQDFAKSENFFSVANRLKILGYVISDYMGGYCYNVDEGEKRQYRIGKVLQKAISEAEKNQSLANITIYKDVLKKFNLDKNRELVEGDYKIVLSYRYNDVASMSTNRGWTSCMDLNSGSVQCEKVEVDVLLCTIVAYFIKGDDLEIKNPIGRLAIKCFTKEYSGLECWLPDLFAYGTFPKNAMTSVIDDFLRNQRFFYDYGQRYSGRYEKIKDLYSDFKSPEVYIYNSLIGGGIDFFNPHKTLVGGYDKDGYDEDGYNKDGYDTWGYNKDGFDKYGYNEDGYDKYGFDEDGYDEDGYDEDGINKDGYNKEGFDKYGFDEDGYDKYGYDTWGFDKDGYDVDGLDSDGFDKDGVQH